MKLLLFQAASFAYSPESLERADETSGDGEGLVVVFIHAEPEDQDRLAALEKKVAKHVKWLANKEGFRRVCLHSFAHLAEEKAPPAVAETFIEDLGRRLEAVGYEVDHTPFGASCAWSLSVLQPTLAKVFKSL